MSYEVISYCGSSKAAVTDSDVIQIPFCRYSLWRFYNVLLHCIASLSSLTESHSEPHLPIIIISHSIYAQSLLCFFFSSLVFLINSLARCMSPSINLLSFPLISPRFLTQVPSPLPVSLPISHCRRHRRRILSPSAPRSQGQSCRLPPLLD